MVVTNMRSLTAMLLALLLAGCAALPAVPPTATVAVQLGIANGTTLDVTVVVNGRPVAESPAGGPPPTIDPARLPPLPWIVEARSPSGRLLTSMRVEPGDVVSDPAMGMHRGAMGLVDLSCGRLTIWAGDVQHSGPVPASPPGRPGDCVP